MLKLWKDVLKTYGLNLRQRENEKRPICQKFQIEVYNSTGANPETVSYITKPSRGIKTKKMGHISSGSQLVLFPNEELKIKICRMI